MLLRSMIVKKSWRNIPRISEKLWSELQPLESPTWRDRYVASATLLSGMVVPCVVFLEKDTESQQSMFPVYGLIRRNYKFDDERMVDASYVREVNPSPYALPRRIALMLEEHGHNDDPIDHAKLRLRDGKEYWIEKTWPGLFVGVPEGYSPADIIGVAEWAKQAYPEIDKEISDNVVAPPPARLCIFRRPMQDRRDS